MGAHDCHYAVLVLPWQGPNTSELDFYVVFKDGIFVVQSGQELLPKASTLCKAVQLGNIQSGSEAYLGGFVIPRLLCVQEALAL